MSHDIRPIALPVAGIESLLHEARAEGYNFIDTLIDDWSAGTNRFNGPGETLLGCFERDSLIAVGGLNVDPFQTDPRVGRIRRVYVRAARRNRGVGRTLVETLIQISRAHFHTVRLRAESPDAARLYERIGFQLSSDPTATHLLTLK